jgi:hypothetical protein
VAGFESNTCKKNGGGCARKAPPGRSTKNIRPVIEFTEIMIRDTLLPEPLELKDRYLDVPTGSGLGLEMTRRRLKSAGTGMSTRAHSPHIRGNLSMSET